MRKKRITELLEALPDIIARIEWYDEFDLGQCLSSKSVSTLHSGPGFGRPVEDMTLRRDSNKKLARLLRVKDIMCAGIDSIRDDICREVMRRKYIHGTPRSEVCLELNISLDECDRLIEEGINELCRILARVRLDD